MDGHAPHAACRRDLLVSVAHMYYAQRLSQQEIAYKLNLSRSNVSRLLKACVEQNVVEFKINDGASKTLDMQQALREAFGLREVIISASEANIELSKLTLAEAVVAFLRRNLRETARLGLGFGTTMYGVARALGDSSPPLMAAEVVQLVGCIGANCMDTDSNVIIREFAHLLSAKPYLLTAPFFVQSTMLKKLLLSEPHIAHHFRKISTIDTVLAAVGSITSPSSLSAIMKSGCISYDEAKALVNSGGEGDFCGLQFTRGGWLVENNVTERIISASYEQLARVPRVYGIAVGVDKTDAVIACLRSKLIHTVFLDEALAQSILHAILH